jgi:hypothetical protein
VLTYLASHRQEKAERSALCRDLKSQPRTKISRDALDEDEAAAIKSIFISGCTKGASNPQEMPKHMSPRYT